MLLLQNNKLNRLLIIIIYNLRDILISQCKTSYSINALSYSNIVYSIGIYLISINLLGLVPYSYTNTAKFIVTLSLSFSVWVMMTYQGIRLHGINSLSFFLPAGTPIMLIPLLTLIELISYISRIISLAVRLAANLLSGHILLKIISTTTWFVITNYLPLSIFPLFVLIIFTFIELFVAILQVYIFIVITSCYLNDATNLH